jgi:hypothetical protein
LIWQTNSQFFELPTSHFFSYFPESNWDFPPNGEDLPELGVLSRMGDPFGHVFSDLGTSKELLSIDLQESSYL